MDFVYGVEHARRSNSLFSWHQNKEASAYSHCEEKSVSVKEREESSKFQYRERAHRAIPLWSLEVLEGTASFYPKLLTVCCCVPFLIGWDIRKAWISWTTYYVFPLKHACSLSPQVRKLRLSSKRDFVQIPFSYYSQAQKINLPGFCNLLSLMFIKPWRPITPKGPHSHSSRTWLVISVIPGDNNTLFLLSLLKAPTHWVVCEDISIYFSYQHKIDVG